MSEQPTTPSNADGPDVSDQSNAPFNGQLNVTLAKPTLAARLPTRADFAADGGYDLQLVPAEKRR